MSSSTNQPWNLESFLDALILELDKAQDTLSVKGLTRRLTYTVRDLALDLHIFPQYDSGKLRFVTASPGESGASRISMQLGSITDRQIREHANEPISRDDITIDEIEDLDEEARTSLKKVGINSTRDLERLERRNVDVESVVSEKAGPEARESYSNLANIINKARRKRLSPRVRSMSAAPAQKQTELSLEGEHLVLDRSDDRFPMALCNGRPVDVVEADDQRVRLVIPKDILRRGSNQLQIALDPYALMTLEVKA